MKKIAFMVLAAAGILIGALTLAVEPSKAGDGNYGDDGYSADFSNMWFAK